jgi:hypothetical protein
MKTPHGFSVVEFLIGLSMVLSIGLFFGLIYVAIHLIQKFW